MHDNKDFDELLNDLNEKKLKQYAATHLSAHKQKQLREILHDKDKLDAVLRSDKAKQLMQQLKGKTDGNQ